MDDTYFTPICKTSHNFIDLTGQRFGRLTVLRIASNDAGYIRWECICDCGKAKIAPGKTLRNGTCKSCGCLSIEKIKQRSTTHGFFTSGKKVSKEYLAWSLMKDRCYNPNNSRYKDWGGRSITVCEEWRHDFKKFYEYIGDAPSSKHSIDRINNDENYEPGNVRWADSSTQSNNRRLRNGKGLTINGITKSANQWERDLHFKKGTLKGRLRRGWCIDCAITLPAAPSGSNLRTHTCTHKPSQK